MRVGIGQLRVGQVITPTRYINTIMASNWRYKAECANIGAGLAPGCLLKIVEINPSLVGEAWVRVEIPGTDPSRYLKLEGRDLAAFDLKCK